MSKFNTTLKSKPDATNLAGGDAYEKSPKLQIASILLTNFCKDSYYENESEFIARLKEQFNLLSDADKIFLAKAAIYARNEFGMRSITHVAAGIILDELKNTKFPWASRFFSAVVSRPDDMSEIISYYWKDGKKSLPNSLKKGFAKAFDKFDNYQIAKYMMKDKAVSLVDIVNLCRPKATERNSSSLHELVANTLVPAETFNNALSKAGRQALDEKEKAQSKAEVWKNFVAKGNKVEMFALLRNLRNIKNDADEDTWKTALTLLVDEHRIKNSKILPFRFLTAYSEFKDPDVRSQDARQAIMDALDISVANVPSFEGTTLVALDDSGSMFDRWCGQYEFDADYIDQPFTLGAIFASALAKMSNATLMIFDNDAGFIRDFNKKDSVMSIVRTIHNHAEGGGTNFSSVFELAAKYQLSYDRIILITDEQSWIGNTRVAFNSYKRKLGIGTKLYMFDLRGHSTLQIPERNCYSLCGFSDKTFDLMQKLELDPQALIHTIEEVSL